MFESTQEAQGLHDVDRRLGTLSAAVLAHVGIGLAIVAVTAMIVPPVLGPGDPPIPFIVIPPIVPGDLTPHPVVPAPKKGTNAAKPPTAIVVPRAPLENIPPLSPASHPPIAADSAPPGPDGPGDGTAGDPDGSPYGVAGGTGRGDTGAGGDSNLDPVYLSADMERPVLLVKVEPSYPEVARRAALGGRVTIRAVVGEDGSVDSAEVVASKNPIFDQAAIEAVRKWRYRPALMNGKPVRIYFIVVVDFLVR